MTTTPSGKAKKTASAFRTECSVAVRVNAPAKAIWKLLTSAGDFPRWNSTVTSVDGEIEQGKKIVLRVPISERAFKISVSELEPERRMVWSSGAAPMFKGVRTFTLSDAPNGATDFEMTEVMSGVMLPLIKGSFPDFGPAFETYAADLKREAERATGC